MWRTARPIWIIFPERECRSGGGGDEGDEAHGNDHLTSINPISTEMFDPSFVESLYDQKSNRRRLTGTSPHMTGGHGGRLMGKMITWQHLFWCLYSANPQPLDVASNSPGALFVSMAATSLFRSAIISRAVQRWRTSPVHVWHEKRSTVMNPLNKEALIKGLTN